MVLAERLFSNQMTLFDGLGNSIWQDKKVLKEDYQPEKILERDEEIEEYRYSLKGVVVEYDEPNDIMLYGKAGVGKTAVTRYVLSELQSAAEKRDHVDPVHVHWHNCSGESVFSTVRALLNEHLPSDADKFPERGLGYAAARDRFFDALEATGGNHIIVLDEIDHLVDANDLLYDIPRAKSNGELKDANVTLIGISNNYQFRHSLSAKVKDSLQEDEIQFPSYKADELVTILKSRAEKSLISDSYDVAALRLAAAIAAKDTGSARQAIDLLRNAGEIAEREDNEEIPHITESHIERAREAVKRGRLTDKISDQPTHTQLVLESVAHLDDAGETPARSKTVKERYRAVANSRGYQPLTTLEGLRSHFSDLLMLGFLSKTGRNDGRAGGSYDLYSLNMDADIVFEVCDDLHSRGE